MDQSREMDDAYNRGDKALAKQMLEVLVEEMKLKSRDKTCDHEAYHRDRFGRVVCVDCGVLLSDSMEGRN